MNEYDNYLWSVADRGKYEQEFDYDRYFDEEYAREKEEQAIKEMEEWLEEE